MTVLSRLSTAFWKFMELITATGTTGMEWTSSTALILTGLFMLLPGIDLDPRIPFQRELIAFLPEFVWGVILSSVGAVQSLANLRRLSGVRMGAAFVAAATWGYLAIVAMSVDTVAAFPLPVLLTLSASQSLAFLVMSLARFRVQRISSGTSLPKVRLNAGL